MDWTQRFGVIALTAWIVSASACAHTPQVFAPQAPNADLTVLLAAHPLPEGQNISGLLLGSTDAVSYHLVQIRDRELPHIHVTHDLAVTLLRGNGQLFVDGEPRPMRAGDVAVVLRGTPHYFVSTGSSPAAAFATFAPPNDGTDQIPVESAH